jgi:hypothetical protein
LVRLRAGLLLGAASGAGVFIRGPGKVEHSTNAFTRLKLQQNDESHIFSLILKARKLNKYEFALFFAEIGHQICCRCLQRNLPNGVGRA